jgi:DNA-binding HxlR family transcriptional regulator
MNKASGYGQYCPLSVATDILCKRWTMLILRELVFGYTSFNDISRGVPRMSRTLLSSRLKELTNSGIIKKETSSSQNHTNYTLTPAGEALRKVVFGMADWAQEWLRVEPSLENLDSDHLMWNIRHKAIPHPSLPEPFIVHFFLRDQTKNRQNSWLIFEAGAVDLCIIDRDFDVDVQIDAAATTLTKVFLGWSDFDEEIRTGALKVFGDEKYTKILPEWLGKSRLATITKQPEEWLVSPS